MSVTNTTSMKTRSFVERITSKKFFFLGCGAPNTTRDNRCRPFHTFALSGPTHEIGEKKWDEIHQKKLLSTETKTVSMIGSHWGIAVARRPASKRPARHFLDSTIPTWSKLPVDDFKTIIVKFSFCTNFDNILWSKNCYFIGDGRVIGSHGLVSPPRNCYVLLQLHSNHFPLIHP